MEEARTNVDEACRSLATDIAGKAEKAFAAFEKEQGDCDKAARYYSKKQRDENPASTGSRIDDFKSQYWSEEAYAYSDSYDPRTSASIGRCAPEWSQRNGKLKFPAFDDSYLTALVESWKERSSNNGSVTAPKQWAELKLALFLGSCATKDPGDDTHATTPRTDLVNSLLTFDDLLRSGVEAQKQKDNANRQLNSILCFPQAGSAQADSPELPPPVGTCSIVELDLLLGVVGVELYKGATAWFMRLGYF